MSKVKELREKYPKVTQITFERLVKGDKTPTKKYLEYLLKSWTNKNESGRPASSNTLIDLVQKFDDYLPFIENKDIYAKEYVKFDVLRLAVERAEKIKEEKTFVKEDHIISYKETDTYILIQPKTHRGSCRYGANTKWCTASKSDSSIFSAYAKDGLLIYLIRKVPLDNSNYNKIALFLRYNSDPYNSVISIFTANDSNGSVRTLSNGGWTEDELMEIFFSFREIFRYRKKYKEVKDEISQFISSISRLDFRNFVENLSKVENALDDSYISTIKEKLDIFLNQIQTTSDAIRKTKN